MQITLAHFWIRWPKFKRLRYGVYDMLDFVSTAQKSSYSKFSDLAIQKTSLG